LRHHYLAGNVIAEFLLEELVVLVEVVEVVVVLEVEIVICQFLLQVLEVVEEEVVEEEVAE
jgi:hypothetical protein